MRTMKEPFWSSLGSRVGRQAPAQQFPFLVRAPSIPGGFVRPPGLSASRWSPSFVIFFSRSVAGKDLAVALMRTGKGPELGGGAPLRPRLDPLDETGAPATRATINGSNVTFICCCFVSRPYRIERLRSDKRLVITRA